MSPPSTLTRCSSLPGQHVVVEVEVTRVHAGSGSASSAVSSGPMNPHGSLTAYSNPPTLALTLTLTLRRTLTPTLALTLTLTLGRTLTPTLALTLALTLRRTLSLTLTLTLTPTPTHPHPGPGPEPDPDPDSGPGPDPDPDPNTVP